MFVFVKVDGVVMIVMSPSRLLKSLFFVLFLFCCYLYFFSLCVLFVVCGLFESFTNSFFFFFSGVLVRDQAVSIHSWTYFSIDVPKSIGLTVAIREKNTVGSLWLFASAKDSPSLTSYDAVERAADSPLHQIDITADFSGLFHSSFSFLFFSFSCFLN